MNYASPVTSLTCPTCSYPMVLQKCERTSRLLYRCLKFPECRTTHGAHPDGTPMGIPADGETRRARARLHFVFDQLWNMGDRSREEAYYILSVIMDIKDAHIGSFDLEQCKFASEKLKDFLSLNKDVIKENKLNISKYRKDLIRLKCSKHGLAIHHIQIRNHKILCGICHKLF